MNVLLALASAVGYGLSDFLGGLLSRRSAVWPVAVVAQCGGLAGVIVASMVIGGTPGTEALMWGAVSGVGNGLGTAFLYRGLATGRMSVVAPLSAVGSAVLPVTVGFATGERPSGLAWAGIACALPAIWLVSAGEGDESVTGEHVRRAGAGVGDALLAGLGFGLLFVALGQVPAGSGLLPVVAGQAVAVVAIVVLATVLRQSWLPRDRHAANAVVVGLLGAAGVVCFQLAAQRGLLAVASVLSSLYPAFTVLLAVVVLREHIHRGQGLGLALAASAVTFVALG